MGKHLLKKRSQITKDKNKKKNKILDNEKKKQSNDKTLSWTKRRYECDICGYKAENKLLMQHHALDCLKTSDHLKSFKCSKCAYKTLVEKNYLQHLKFHEEHFKVNVFYCANCPFKAKVKQSLIVHMSRHFLNAKFQCSFCSYSSERQSTIHSHQWIHPEYVRNTIYQCIHCTYQTRIKSHFDRHQIVHERIFKDYDEAVFKCTYCPFKCVYKSSLDRHNVGHERKHGLQCNFCSYTATNIAGLTLHKRNQHAQIEKPFTYINLKYKCTTCACQTNKHYHYSRHLTTHEDRRDNFECIICTSKSKSSLTLKEHILSHKTESGFQCQDCSFRSGRLTLLNVHMITVHKNKFQDAKLFSCSNCSYTTIKKSDLKRHLTRHQKPNEINWMSCNECPFKAKRKYQLVDHLKNHKLTKGIKCCYCSYHSSSKTGLLFHMKLHI